MNDSTIVVVEGKYTGIPLSEFKQLIKALRSSKYKKIKRDEHIAPNKFCFMGLASDIMIDGWWELCEEPAKYWISNNSGWRMLISMFKSIFKDRPIYMNDTAGVTFEQFADKIEKWLAQNNYI